MQRALVTVNHGRCLATFCEAKRLKRDSVQQFRLNACTDLKNATIGDQRPLDRNLHHRHYVLPRRMIKALLSVTLTTLR